MSPGLRDAYWTIVRDCLIRFYGFSESEATRSSVDLRHRVEDAPEGVSPDMIYNAEALDVAADLAGREVDRRKVWSEYVRMMNRHFAAVRTSKDMSSPPPGILPAA